MTPTTTKSLVCRLFFICLFLICLTSVPLVVKAGNFPVTTGSNAGAGSLRQAILDANAAGAGPHTITFTVAGTINITAPLPAITVSGVTIDGAGTITISAMGGDIDRDIFNVNAGNTTIKGMTLQNTGSEAIQLNGNLSGVRIEDIVIRHTVNDWINHGIYVANNSTNMTIKNVTITDVQSACWGLRFIGNVTNLMVDNYKTFNGSGNAGRGVQIQGVANGVTIKNSLIDLNSPVTTDDGDFGIYFNTSASNVNIDSCTFHDTERYGLYFAASASNIQIKHSTFDNFNGWASNQMIFFNSHVNGIMIDSVEINLDQSGTTDDGNNAIWFNGNMQSVTIQKSTFKMADDDAIYAIYGLNNDNITITKNTFLNNGSTSVHAAIHLTHTRNTTSDNGPVLISDNIFRNNIGEAIYLRPTNGTTYIIPNLTIRNNVITGTSGGLGGIKINYIDKIVITQNSIYNNVGNGIDLSDNTAANCAYEGANKPQLLSSAETAPGSGIYTVTVKMPSICGTNACSLELFSNEAGVKGVGGQHYVQTFTGLGQGTRTLTNVTGSFAEITAAPYGTWTATLRAAANCGTSEFSNKIPIKVNGPAGVDLGIRLWLRGDDISVNGSEPTADGQVITGWEEFSGGGGPSATTVINNPVVRLGRINFNPVADMDADGIRGHLPNASSWITNNTITTVAVFNPLSATASGDRFFTLFSQAGNDANTNAAQIEFYRTVNNINSYRGNTLLSPAITGTTGVKAFDRPGVFSSITTATNHSYNYNGASMGSGNYNKGNFAISQWFIGTGYNSTDGWSYQSETDFAEVFTYNRTLTALELQKVQSYMALKYGIAMKQNYVLSNGTQVWDVSANAAYSKEIAALVKDNLSILHQKQARAFHTDELVSIGLGTALAATNKDNEGEITNNLSILMWGNDSAATAFTANFTGGTYSNTRMPRVWKVQKTNWADQDITIQLKGGKDNNFLLISTDPTFASGVQELKLTKDGTITLSSSLLANGVYFTFGRQQKMPGGVLNGLSVWVKADVGVEKSGTNAITWEDQAPAMRVWPKVNTVALTWNSAAMNYNPAIVFPGPTNPNYFGLPQFTNTFTQGEVFSVQSSAVNNVAGFPFQLGGTSGTTTVFYRFTDNNMYLHFGTNARRQFSFGTKNMALPAILNVNSATNSWTSSLDGKVMAGPAAYATSFVQQGASNAIGVGYGSYFDGPISEVILYNRKLNATERVQVNSYMALKYGITLDQTTPTSYLASDGATTMWNAANNAGYTFNIAGIGRDENGSLYQKQSRNINTAANGNLIAVAVGDQLAVSNADNTDSIENDKSFLVWGDNNGAITYTTNVTGGAHVTLRMPRVWKADKTNWNDKNITIKLYGSARNTYLLISNSDASFATIDQEIALNGDSTITLNTSLLPDGAYFTFGKEILGPGYVNNGVQMWLRADDNISGSTNWYDFSGNSTDAAQATVASQPAFTTGMLNFNPALKFDGTNDYMQIAQADISGKFSFGNTARTFVAIAMPTSNATDQTPFTYGTFVANQASGFRRTTLQEAVFEGHTLANNVMGPANSFPINKTTLIGGRYTGGTTGVASLFTNSTSSVASVTRNWNTLISAHGAQVGKYVGESRWWNGYIGEVIVYNRNVTDLEYQRISAYLALKYGITLSQAAPTDYIASDGTTKMWTNAKNTSYGFRIAGIGRDDLTKLYQKQSRSVDTGALITIAAGTTIAADNISNTATIDDLSFFTWSDNNLAPTFTTPVSGVANATHRMARVWKVDRTNWADQDITINSDKLGVRYLLVNATDPAFGAGTTEYIINTTTSSATINTADLPDGAYFTLATKIVGPGCVNTNILSWLRADYGATGGADWNDFSGNMNKVNQPTAASQPSLVAGGLNFNPAMNFDGSNDWYNLPATLYNANDSITAFYITRADNVTPTWMTLTEFGEDRPGLYWNLGAPNAWVATANPLSSPHTRKFSTSSAALFTFTLPNSNPKNYKVGANGLEQTFTGSAGTFSIGAGNANKRLGGVVVDRSQVNFDGYMGEVVFYKGIVTDADKQRIHSYLALKYGITLDQTTPTDYVASDWDGATGTKMWTAADNAGYGYRITGIGRDDCDDLHQKQSRSQDAGLVTISIGSVIAPTNAENADSIVANNSYLVFGDNNLDTTWSVPLTATGISPTVRMPRIWKVDKTNWIDQSIIIKFNRKNLNTYLLISTDPSFSTGVQEMPIDPGDSLVVFNSELIPDGAYFTFAREVYGPGYVNNGIQMWLRADDGSSTGALWGDFSGNENDATQATAASQPVAVTSGINFNPAFDFDGTDDYLDVVNGLGISGGNPFTVMGLGMRQTAGTWDAYVAQPNANTNDLFFGYNTTNVAASGATGVSSITGATVFAANVPNFIGITRLGNTFSFYANGKPDGTPTGTYSFNVDGIRIGNRNASADLAFDGYMGEVFVYNRVLNTTELQRAQSYLSLKYGITLNGGNTSYAATDWDGSTGTIYWDATADAAYKNNIAGIGRDDKTSLLQKQSRSVNTAASGNMVAIGLGSIAATNAANTASFDDDISYMVWGDNGLTGTKSGNLATAEVPAVLDANGCSKFTRLQREWKVQETGNVGAVQVQFYLTGMVPNSATISDFSLLIDDDGDFASGATSVVQASAYDAATQTLTFDNVDFANGQYFTVVTDATNEAPGGVINNLYTWYRADKGVTTATGVSQWNDQSTSPKNTTQATTTAQPVYNTTSSLINFNPTLGFNGTATVLSNGAISHTAATAGEEIFAVVLPNNATGVQDVVGLGTAVSSTNTTELRYNAGRLEYLATSGPITSATASNGRVQLANAHRAASGAGNAFLLLNGTQVATGTVSATPTLTQLNIGARRLSAANSQFFNGQVAEVAVYNGELTVANREKIASYLAIKYGIPLSHNYVYPDNTIVWDQSINTGYGNNITAIGRDDCNGLHQKQSKSVDAGAMITIGSGGEISASNAANLNGLENNTALVLGDNNAAINAWTATEAPAGRNRITREWKLQLTGTVGTVLMQVPASTSTATNKLPAEINKMYMLVDADGDFSSGAEEVQMTLNGANWEVSYEFAGNAYFTFATGTNFLVLTSKAILQGAWDGTVMRTDLKTTGVLPATDPYGLNTTPSVAPNASAAQVVDWIRVELRDVNDPTTIVSSRAGFVLANGNIVDTNYTGALAFYGVDAGNYYVAVRHRNHLGVMSFAAADFSAGTATIDFTSSTADMYGNNGRIDLGSAVMGLWAGNANGDSSIRHSAKPSDASAIANAVLTHSGNTTADPAYTGFSNVYSVFDVNLDGKVYYSASPSDRTIIVNNVRTHPANSRALSSFIITGQLP